MGIRRDKFPIKREVKNTADVGQIDGARLRYVVQEDQNGMPVKWAIREAFGLSARLLRKLKDQKGVLINGKAVRLVDPVQTGDQVEIYFPKEQSGIEPEEIPLSVLYEDNDLLVIDKQPGLVVHPTKGYQNGTVLNAVLYHMQQRQESYKPRLVNRLDRDTSGVLMIAKNSHSQDGLARQMSADSVAKIYLAILNGILSEREGTIDLPIGKRQETDICRSVCENGDPSRTHYRVMKHYVEGYTLAEIRLETGRTHQIRVHMSHIGHPVVGDQLYGAEIDKDQVMIARQALHATSLSFVHPVTGSPLQLTAPLPEDMNCLLAQLCEMP